MSTTKFILRKFSDINYERMNKTIDIISKKNNKSKFYIRCDMVKNFITRGIGYTDYFRGDYINLTRKQKDTYVTSKSFYKILHYLNDKKYEVLLNDKIVFNRLFYKYLKRDFITLDNSSLNDFKKFISNKDIIFAKNPTGFGGHGVSKIVKKNIKNLEQLYQELKEKNQILIEEAIEQSKELNEINPYVVNSFRIVTLYKDGKVYIINNALRVNQDESEIIGCTNDLYFKLNEDGTISGNVIDDYANVYESHPLTGKKFKDVKIKGVDDAFSMVKEAALLVPKMRYVGWDIAFTDNGPVLLEGNEYPGFGILQFYKLNNSKEGHLKEISDVLGDEIKKIKL